MARLFELVLLVEGWKRSHRIPTRPQLRPDPTPAASLPLPSFLYPCRRTPNKAASQALGHSSIAA